MRVLSVITTLFVSLVFSAQAYACSCVQPSGWISEIIADQEVFYGTAIESKMTAKDETSLWHQVKTKFLIKQKLTGDISSNEYLYHSAYSASCGIQFSIAESEWVFASRLNDGKLGAGSCGQHKNLIPTIIEYHETGNDTYVPDYNKCYDVLNSKDPNFVSNNNISKQDCVFWSEESINERRKYLWEHRKKNGKFFSEKPSPL